MLFSVLQLDRMDMDGVSMQLPAKLLHCLLKDLSHRWRVIGWLLSFKGVFEHHQSSPYLKDLKLHASSKGRAVGTFLNSPCRSQGCGHPEYIRSVIPAIGIFLVVSDFTVCICLLYTSRCV